MVLRTLELPFVRFTPTQAKIFVECLGTIVYVLTASLAEHEAGQQALSRPDRSRNLAPLAVGFMLASLVFTFGYVSGAHFNPAVSLGVMLVDVLRIELAVAYVIAQLIGGFVGALIAGLLVSQGAIPAPTIFNDRNAANIFRGFASEAIFTGTLVSVVLHTTCSKQKNNHHYGLAIGMVMACGLYAAGGMTHGAFNPASATAMMLVRCMGRECRPLLHVWLYWAAPAAGTVVATVVYKMLHPRVRDDADPEDDLAALY